MDQSQPSPEMAPDRFRDYLMCCCVQVDRRWLAKIDTSNRMQQTLLKAHQARDPFRGGDAVQQTALPLRNEGE
ncbi:MAG TPA: hypothetical protein VMG10_03615 [Gemmataceae bacterium]|nr:hypothetical protein [Gemmataceae bacterium]